MAPVAWLNRSRVGFVRAVIGLGALTSIYLFCLWQTQSLGINPFETLIAFTGQWCINFLILTLLITPLRQTLPFIFKRLRLSYGSKISHWSFLFLARKSLGNYALFYGAMHAWVYLYLELSWDWLEAGYDILERPFLAFGVLAFLGLLVLGATSPKRVQHKLSHYWRKIHFAVYAIAVCVIVHLVLEQKPNTPLPWRDIVLILALLLYRILHLLKRLQHHRKIHQKRLAAGI